MSMTVPACLAACQSMTAAWSTKLRRPLRASRPSPTPLCASLRTSLRMMLEGRRGDVMSMTVRYMYISMDIRGYPRISTDIRCLYIRGYRLYMVSQ